MATVTTAQIQQIYIGFLGRAADKAGLDYWVNEITNDNLTLEQLRANITNEQAEYTDGYGQLSRGDLIDAVYQALFERAPDAAGKAYWETGDGAGVNADRLIQAFIDGASTDDQSVLDNKTEVAEYYTTSAGANYSAASAASTIADVDGGAGAVAAGKALVDTQFNQGTTFTLTDGRDTKVGTADNDTFLGLAGQNQDGAIANALSTGDMVDGGDGIDTIQASLIRDNEVDGADANMSINARTTNVEKVMLEVLEAGVEVDAGRMDSVTEFWSDNSDENLDINDVRLGSKLAVTKDITFGLRDVDKDAGLTAAFDTQSLTNEGSTKADSQLLIRIADVNTETPTTPLANVNMQLSFELGGQSYNITDLKSTDGSYAGLVTALDNALDALGLTNVEAKLGEAYNQVTVAGNTVTLPFTANQILLNDPAGAEFGQVTFEQSAIQPIAGSFLVAGNAEPFDPSTSTTLIESNLILDNAGRGSTAGDVMIGGMSNSGKVVEKLNLMVDRDSKIDELTSGHNMEAIAATAVAFEQIEVTSLSNDGDLSIGNIYDTKLFNASAFEGEKLTVSGDAESQKAYSYTTAGSKDTVTVDVDLAASRSHNFSIDTNTQGGDDTVTYNLFDDGGSPNNHTATNFLNTVQLSNVNVNTGAGDDIVNLTDGNDVAGGDNMPDGYVVGDVELGAGNDAVFVANDNLEANKAQWVFNATTSGTSYRGNGNDQYQVFGLKLKVEFQGIESDFIEVNYDTSTYKTSAQAINDAVKDAIKNDINLKHLLKTTDLRDNGLQIDSLVDRALDDNALNVEFLAPKFSDNGTVDKQDDTTGNYQNDSIAIFEARNVVTDTDMEAAWAAWYPGSTGIGGISANAPYNVGAGDARALFDAMHDVADSGDINSNGGLNVLADNDSDSDSNMDDGVIATYNKMVVRNGDNAGETAIVEITGSSGDDLIVLNSNKNATGYATVELTNGFGNDTIVNFNTGNASVAGSTADVIDYTAFLDEVANARGDSASTVAANDMRIEQDVTYSFQNLANGDAATAQIDHNKVITVDLEDLFDDLTATANELPETFDGVTAAMVQRALNEILTDADFVTNGLGEDKQAGSQVVFNVVHSKHFEHDGSAVVMGDDTDNTTQAVFTATVAYDGSATGDNLSLTGMVKQGTIEFGDMYSDITDLTAASIGGTGDQKTAAKAVIDRLDDTNGAVVVASNDSLSAASTLTAGGAVAAGTNIFIDTGVTVTGAYADVLGTVNNNIDFVGNGSLQLSNNIAYDASVLSTIDANAAMQLDVSNAASVSGTVAQVKTAQDASGISSLADINVTLTASTASAADLNAVITNAGTGTVSTTAALTINTLDSATVAGLGGDDTFVFADGDTGVAITAFGGAGTDVIDLNALTAETTTSTTVDSGDGSAVTATAGGVYVFAAVDGGGADAENTAHVIAGLDTDGFGFATGTDSAYLIATDADSSAIYKYTEAGTANAQAGELVLIGTVDAVLSGANIALS